MKKFIIISIIIVSAIFVYKPLSAMTMKIVYDLRYTDGLVGYWSFNGPDMDWSSSTAEALDRSGSSNNGNAVNMSQTTSPIPGKVGQALKFDGVNDYVGRRVTDPMGLNGKSAMTAEAWIKPNVLSGDQVIAIANGPFQFSLEGSKLGDSAGVIYNGSVWTGLLGNTNLVAGNWYYVAMTYDGANLKLYVNGVQDASTAITGNLSGAGHLFIGAYSTGSADPSGSYFNGAIDEVRIYNRALTAGEIREHYVSGVGR